MFSNFSIYKTVDVNFGPLDLSPSRSSAHELTVVRGGRRTSFDNRSVIGNEILFGYDHVGKGVVHHAADILKTLKSGFDWGCKIVLEVLGKEMINPIDIVLILESAGKCSDCSHVSVNS